MCEEALPLEKFQRGKSQCRSCRNERTKKINRDRYNNDPEFRAKSLATTRNAAFIRRYGITADEVEAMFDKQGRVCAICREEPKTPHVDHDHETGIVRGILCYRCNVGIGYFKDSKHRLIAAGRYLQAGGYDGPEHVYGSPRMDITVEA